MTANKNALPTPWVDPDDAPELTEDFFQHAEFAIGETVIRPATATMKRLGRPKSDKPKVPVNLRLDQEVVEHFRASGAGWQSRINSALRKAAGLG